MPDPASPSAPRNFQALAVVAAFLILVGSATAPAGFVNGYRYDDSVQAFIHGLIQLCTLMMTIAPFVALRSITIGTALVLPRLLLVPFTDLAWPWMVYVALLAVAMCASWSRPFHAGVLAVLATGLPIGVILGAGRLVLPYGGEVSFDHTRSAGYLLLTCALYVVGTALAMGFAAWLRLVARQQEGTRLLAGERREVARDAAVLDERARLARDLHDVVAHHISLIAVRAETAPYTSPDLSPGARSLFADIAEDSRRALDELRRVLGVLRRVDGTPERAPQPTAAGIGGLVLDAQFATDVVSASLQGLDTVQPTPGYVAYRVVQEALTNARSHAPGEPVDVIAHGDGAGGIRVLVTNRAPNSDGFEHGGGLSGMSERVAALGGELEVELSAGEFRVEARLPAAPPSGAGS